MDIMEEGLMASMIDLNKYKEFVDGVTSETSKSLNDTRDRLTELEDMGLPHPSRILTGAIGISGEVGEYNELVKKLMFHGKPYNQEFKDRLESELGDIMWYWIQNCLALHLDPNEVIAKNFEKLKDRHPDGEFNPRYVSDSGVSISGI